MSISASDIIVLYRYGDTVSRDFAEYYQDLYGLSPTQLLGLNCSSTEILPDYATFQTEIEFDVAAFLSITPYKAILVSPNVPGGFMSGGNVIATTSRLARIGHTFSPQTANPLFNRRIYSDYNNTDAAQVLICSRVDAPDFETAKAVLDNTTKFIKQGKANGKFFFDPYAVLQNGDETAYYNELVDFRDHLLPILNLKVFSTTPWDEYTDVVVPRLSQDSFMWAWKADRAGYTFFQDSNTARVFLYNADSDGAGAMRDAEDKRFPLLAISSGYIATAGAMSDPSPSGHLRPTPFFEALFKGATIGEAFAFACPYLDWTVGLIGDPLVTVSFPKGTSLNLGQSPLAIWEEIHDHLASALAYMSRRENDLYDVRDAVTDLMSTEQGVLLPLFDAAYTGYKNQWKNPFRQVISGFVAFSTNGDTTQFAFDKFLAANDLKVSRLLPAVAGSYIASDTNLLDSGYWQVEATITTSNTRFSTYHFQLDIASDVDFNNITYSFDTATSRVGWAYEKGQNDFEPIPSGGVPSSYAGRRVRFSTQSSQYMDRYTIYYYRIRQRDDLGGYTSYVTAKAIVYT
jgi:uncharacterized protein (TIGR03790 family)